MKIVTAERGSCGVIFEALGGREDGAEEKNSGLRITLIPALIKKGAMDMAVRQAVEAGTAAIWPVETAFCQVHARDSESKMHKKERWMRIADAARRQCGGGRPTNILGPAGLSETLERWDFGAGPLIFLHQKALPGGSSFHRYLAEPADDFAIMTGPEGGFAPSEVEEITARGGRPVYLGPRVLRAETAVLYGIAAAATIMRERSEWRAV